uniref:Uncharacterized protein n=1 Tax=Marseillevirus LCMAC201 TaxID=2506605 RepID=A0A481YWF9_9VIRU|nr:MAG: hypothetical protein LCMAC201_04280 [Marseillevirus LCMAC201]
MLICSELQSTVCTEIDNGFDPSTLGGQEIIVFDYWESARQYLLNHANACDITRRPVKGISGYSKSLAHL